MKISLRQKSRIDRTALFHRCSGFWNDCYNINAVYQQQDTAYIDILRNYRYLCPYCQEESDKYWAEQWDDYYKGRL